MKSYYRLRVHFNNGFIPLTIHLSSETFEEANEVWEAYCHQIDSRSEADSGHVKSVALLEGRKRPCYQRFEAGRRL